MQWDLDKRTEKVLWDRKKLEADVYAANLDISADGTRLAILLRKEGELEQGKPLIDPPPHRVEVLEVPGGKELFKAEGKDVANCLTLSPIARRWYSAMSGWRSGISPATRSCPTRRRHPADSAESAQGLAGLANRLPCHLFAQWQIDRDLSSAQLHFLVERRNRRKDCRLHAQPGAGVISSARRDRFFARQRPDGPGRHMVLRLFDTASGKEISSWPGHRLPISNIQFSPDGERLFTYNQSEVCGCQSRPGSNCIATILSELEKYLLGESFEQNLIITYDRGEYLLEDLPSGNVLAKFPLRIKNSIWPASPTKAKRVP